MSWEKGQIYEQKAADYLQEHNYLILEKNWHAGRYGEIDFICLKEFTLIFIEVKGRSGRFAATDSLEAINKSKAKKLWHSANHYLLKAETDPQLEFVYTRFDLIAIYGSNIQHLPDIDLLNFIKHL